MKTIFAIINHPLYVAFSAVLGSAMVIYLQEVAVQSLMWFLPCTCVILADLCAGIPAARFRHERVTFSTAVRRTVNKALCYLAWILFCVCLDERYNATWPAWFGMGIVFFIEGCSFVGNILEPKGYRLSIKGLLAMIGQKHNVNGLENLIEKNDGTDTAQEVSEGEVFDRRNTHRR